MIMLKFGTGNILLANFGDEEVTYGLAMKDTGESHTIGAENFMPYETVEAMNPDVCLQFTNTRSIQVLIDKLEEIKSSLMAGGY